MLPFFDGSLHIVTSASFHFDLSNCIIKLLKLLCQLIIGANNKLLTPPKRSKMKEGIGRNGISCCANQTAGISYERRRL